MVNKKERSYLLVTYLMLKIKDWYHFPLEKSNIRCNFAVLIYK